MGFFSFLIGLFGHHPAPAPTTYVPPAPLSVPSPSPMIVQLNRTDIVVVQSVQNSRVIVTVKLADENKGAWVRLMLPNGDVSPITKSPAGDFIGLGGNSAHQFAFDYLSGVKVQTSPDPAQPFVTVAFLR